MHKSQDSTEAKVCSADKSNVMYCTLWGRRARARPSRVEPGESVIMRPRSASQDSRPCNTWWWMFSASARCLLFCSSTGGSAPALTDLRVGKRAQQPHRRHAAVLMRLRCRHSMQIYVALTRTRRNPRELRNIPVRKINKIYDRWKIYSTIDWPCVPD